MRLETCLLMGMFLGTTAYGETWTVDDDGNADFTRIQDAIDWASDGDEIAIYPGTYTGGSFPNGWWCVFSPMGKELWIHGVEGQPYPVINGNGINRGAVCVLGETSATIIERMIFRDCYVLGEYAEGAGVYVGNSSPTFINVHFQNCVAEGWFLASGGAVHCVNSWSTFTSCGFGGYEQGNEAYGGYVAFGGAVSFVNNCPEGYDCGSHVLDGCGFQANVARTDGETTGVWAMGGAVYTEKPTSITNCGFGSKMVGNQVRCPLYAQGAAIAFWGAANTDDVLTVEDCDFQYNSVHGVDGSTENGEGGAIRVLSAGSTYISESYFLSNHSWAYGTIAVTGCPLIINGEVIVDNHDSVDLIGSSSILNLLPGSSLMVDGDVTLTGGGVLMFDIDDLGAQPTLDTTQGNSGQYGTLFRNGGISISNESGSLSNASVGDTIILARVLLGGDGFQSAVFPPMPDGLGLELVEQEGQRVDLIYVRVIEAESTDLDDPFPDDLPGTPIDIIEFDADGDGSDEIAVLFSGQPGLVVAYSVSGDGPPEEIDGLSAFVGNDPVDIDAGDFNDDGRDDLIIANSSDNTISLLTSLGPEDGLYFDTETISVTGSGHVLVCIAAMDWDGDPYTDVALGLDFLSGTESDEYRVITNAGNSPSAGPSFEIPNFPIPGGDPIADSPTDLDGGTDDEAWGFVGGTNQGRVHRISAQFGIQLLGELNGNRVTVVLVQELDDAGGDGQADLLVASDQAETIFLLQGDESLPDNFGDFISLGVGSSMEDVIALDVDADDDVDLIMTAPDSDIPLLLLRNEGVAGVLGSAMGGRTWSMQGMNSSNPPNHVASGKTDPGDVGDNKDLDWVAGTGPLTGLLGGPGGTMEQTNLLADGASCDADLDGSGTVGVGDLLIVIDQWGGCKSCSADLNGDGTVGVADLLAVIDAWGACP